MERYLVLNKDGDVINTILWDGKSEWTPPEGCTVVRETEHKG